MENLGWMTTKVRLAREKPGVNDGGKGLPGQNYKIVLIFIIQ